MTDERIIKALKHCYEHKSCNDCVGCLGAEECILNVDPAGYIYPIINRQQAELDDLKRDTIPKLQDSLKRANKYGLETDKENEQLKAEIERLKEEIEIHQADSRRLVSAYKQCAYERDVLLEMVGDDK